jgi:hypothetical protein
VNSQLEKPNEAANPFSLEVTVKALENLGVTNANARTLAVSIPPTHEYIKFTPSTAEELAELQNLGYELSETPLDENVAAYQAAYPGAVPVTPFGTFYTLKPIQYQLSLLASTTPSVKISQIVLFDENAGDEYDGDEPVEPEPIPDPWEPTPGPGYCYDNNLAPYVCDTEHYVRKNESERKSAIHEATVLLLKAGVNLRELYNERMRLAGHEDEVEEVSTTGRTQGYLPAGRIMVRDNSINADVPLKNTVIKTRRWFKLDETTTNGSGNFSIDKSYRKKAHVIVKFRNNQTAVRGISGKLKIWEYVLVLEKELGLFEGSALQNVNYTFAYSANADNRDALQWVAAHFMNTHYEFKEYCYTNGLPLPPSNLNVWVSDKVTQSASAPMLRAITNPVDLDAVSRYIFPNSTTSILQPLKIYPPDITMRIQSGSGSTTRNAADVSGTFFHELAHSIHYGKVGNAYWAAEIAYTVAKGGYGNKNDNGAGRAAVVEAWGFYLGPTFNRTKYISNTAIATAELNFLERQQRDDAVAHRSFNGTTSGGWIPWGFLHDCTDIGEPVVTAINDQVSGYTMSMLFRGYTSTSTTIPSLRDNILFTNNQNQSTQVANLTTSYGW